MNLEETMRRELRRFLVQKHITCPLTGEVLDMDKSVFILDADGDPAGVFSQSGWQRALAIMDGDASKVLAAGYTVDESTVRP